jgi:ABC-type Fe3+ transport system permease subunit
MSDVEVLLTLAGAVITVWLSLFVGAFIWLGRRAVRRGRRELHVIAQAVRLRTRRAIVNGIGALLALVWLLVSVLFVAPLLVTIGPLLLAIAGLDLTAHIVRLGH